jgi:heat shock protein HslJ
MKGASRKMNVPLTSSVAHCLATILALAPFVRPLPSQAQIKHINQERRLAQHEQGRDPLAIASFSERVWKVLELGDQPLSDGDRSHKPHLIISRTGSVKGFTGCNLLSGGLSQGVEPPFLYIATTERHCISTAELEKRFLKALHSTVSLNVVDGKILELRGSSGTVQMRLDTDG